jgi:hypothetical protein
MLISRHLTAGLALHGQSTAPPFPRRETSCKAHALPVSMHPKNSGSLPRVCDGQRLAWRSGVRSERRSARRKAQGRAAKRTLRSHGLDTTGPGHDRRLYPDRCRVHCSLCSQLVCRLTVGVRKSAPPDRAHGRDLCRRCGNARSSVVRSLGPFTVTSGGGSWQRG